MHTYEVRIKYFKHGSIAKEGIVIVETDSVDEEEIFKLAKAKALPTYGPNIKMMSIVER